MPDEKKTVVQKTVEIMEGRAMSFREKMAYVSLFALGLASFFFAGLRHEVHQQGGDMHGDWKIAARAGHAGGVAMAGLLGIAVFSSFTGASKETLVQFILLGFLLSGIVSNGAKIYLYRSGL